LIQPRICTLIILHMIDVLASNLKLTTCIVPRIMPYLFSK